MYSVRHFSCYFICIYFVVDDYIDLGQYKWILLQNTKEIGTINGGGSNNDINYVTNSAEKKK